MKIINRRDAKKSIPRLELQLELMYIFMIVYNIAFSLEHVPTRRLVRVNFTIIGKLFSSILIPYYGKRHITGPVNCSMLENPHLVEHC